MLFSFFFFLVWCNRMQTCKKKKILMSIKICKTSQRSSNLITLGRVFIFPGRNKVDNKVWLLHWESQCRVTIMTLGRRNPLGALQRVKNKNNEKLYFHSLFWKSVPKTVQKPSSLLSLFWKKNVFAPFVVTEN